MAKCAPPEEANTEPDTGHCEINIFIHIYVYIAACIYVYVHIYVHVNISLYMFTDVTPAAAVQKLIKK